MATVFFIVYRTIMCLEASTSLWNLFIVYKPATISYALYFLQYHSLWLLNSIVKVETLHSLQSIWVVGNILGIQSLKSLSAVGNIPGINSLKFPPQLLKKFLESILWNLSDLLEIFLESSLWSLSQLLETFVWVHSLKPISAVTLLDFVIWNLAQPHYRILSNVFTILESLPVSCQFEVRDKWKSDHTRSGEYVDWCFRKVTLCVVRQCFTILDQRFRAAEQTLLSIGHHHQASPPHWRSTKMSLQQLLSWWYDGAFINESSSQSIAAVHSHKHCPPLWLFSTTFLSRTFFESVAACCSKYSSSEATLYIIML